MTAGKIVGITQIQDGIRFTVDCNQCTSDHGLEVYATEAAKAVRLGDSVWTQSRQAMWTGRDGRWLPDTVLYEIRRDWNGYVWTLEEAMHGRRVKVA